MDTIKIDGQEVPWIHAKTRTIIKHKKTGEVYPDETALKAANIPEEDVKRDVQVIMPSLDLFAKTK